jgi:hypothetical protein
MICIDIVELHGDFVYLFVSVSLSLSLSLTISCPRRSEKLSLRSSRSTLLKNFISFRWTTFQQRADPKSRLRRTRTANSSFGTFRAIAFDLGSS